jgi:hypothetical protein
MLKLVKVNEASRDPVQRMASAMHDSQVTYFVGGNERTREIADTIATGNVRDQVIRLDLKIREHGTDLLLDTYKSVLDLLLLSHPIPLSHQPTREEESWSEYVYVAANCPLRAW